MAACEKCWNEARRRHFDRGECDSVTDAYYRVMAEVEDAGQVCTPAEQCGDLHVIVDESCRCGLRAAPPRRATRMGEPRDLVGLCRECGKWRGWIAAERGPKELGRFAKEFIGSGYEVREVSTEEARAIGACHGHEPAPAPPDAIQESLFTGVSNG